MAFGYALFDGGLKMKYQCQNCNEIADEDDDEAFELVQDVHERFLPGDIYTDLQCVSCGALAYPVEETA